MFDDDGLESGPRGTFETYKAEGDALFMNGENRKAIDSYSIALELRRDDRECLVSRSKCYLQLGDTENALLDAEASLKKAPNYHKGLFHKAEALYYRGEFELALMFYHRGNKMRPELQEFRRGIQKAQEAIDNSVGSPDRVKLTKEGDLSYFENLDEPKQKTRSQPAARSQVAQKQRATKPAVPKSIANDKTVKKMLGELYGDRVYLEMLMKDTDQHTDTGKKIYDLVSDGLHYLDTRCEFWRQQQPMHARKREQRRRKPEAMQTVAPDVYLLHELSKIDEEQSKERFADSIQRANRCLKKVESYRENDLQNRNDYIAHLHSYLGNGYLKLGNRDEALLHHQIDLDTAQASGLSEAKSRALDNLGRVYAELGKFPKAIEVWMQKLKTAESKLERAWLYHEVGRCYFEMGKHKEACDNGQRSAAEAEQARDALWQMNATVLMAQSQLKLKELPLALTYFEAALDMAQLKGDKAAESAIQLAITGVKNRIAETAEAQDVADKEAGSAEDAPAPVQGST